MNKTFEQRLAAHYGELTDTLQGAADFVLQNPVDMATRPLRAISKSSGRSPAAYTRLSRALGYDGLDDLREEFRQKLGQGIDNFADRAQRLQDDHGVGKSDFMAAHLSACQGNLNQLSESIDQGLLDQAVDVLCKARRVNLLGALGSTGIIEYMSYMANMCVENWQLLGRMGASLGSGLSNISSQDALIVVTKPPFAAHVIKAAEIARARGAYVIVITDVHSCPALGHAHAGFVVPTDSPHFYSSYVSTLFLAEVLIGKLVSRSGEKARLRIADVEDSNRLLSEVSDEETVTSATT